MWLLLATAALAAETVDIGDALAEGKKPSWEPKGKAMDLFLGADVSYRKKDWRPAAEGMVDALEAQPGCGKCLFRLTRSLSELGDLPHAAEASEKLAAWYPDAKDGLALSMSVLVKAGHPAKAEKLSVSSREKWPSWPEAWFYGLKAAHARADGDMAGVVAAARGGGLDEKDVNCLGVLAQTWARDVDGAKAAWDGCKEAETDLLRESAEGWLALSSGDWATAQKWAGRIDDEAQSRTALVELRLTENNAKGALVLAEKLVADFPNHLDALVGMARAQAGAGLSGAADATLQPLFGAGWTTSWKEHPVLLSAMGPDWATHQMAEAVALRVELLRKAGNEAAAGVLVREGQATFPGDPALARVK